jgi:2Fe-2S ferredoxin
VGGSNPYIQTSKYELPRQAYEIKFLPLNKVVRVEPSELPYSRDGAKGSLLEIALGHDIDIDHACGGVCACSTCHVIVREGLESCNEAGEAELDQLDNARGLTPKSRLACQTVPDGSRRVVVEIPGWNRNLVREDHH